MGVCNMNSWCGE